MKSFLALGPGGMHAAHVELATGSVTAVDGQPETLLIPGFVDIHIHGALGFDFMSATTASEVSDWCDQLGKLGYESLLPTTVTASTDSVRRALSMLPAHPMIAGFHLEGPFISTVYPGAQPKEFIVTPQDAAVDWSDVLEDPRLRVITMAPEIEGAMPLIKTLSGRGVIVSLGHTNATFSEAIRAASAGARHTTHTYNAMRPLHHREAGMVGFALSEPSVSTELIYDRHHVCRDAAAILIRAKASDKVIAISDGTMAAGLPAGTELLMWDVPTIVGDGTVRLVDGTLAGSAITMLDAFRNLAADFSLEVAIRACCLNPRIDLGLTRVHRWIEMSKDLEIVAIHDVAD